MKSKSLVLMCLVFTCMSAGGCALKRVPMAIIEPVYSYVTDPLVQNDPFERTDNATAVASVPTP